MLEPGKIIVLRPIALRPVDRFDASAFPRFAKEFGNPGLRLAIVPIGSVGGGDHPAQ